MNTYRVAVRFNNDATGCAVKVTTATREEAPAAAVAVMVEHARKWNAQYADPRRLGRLAVSPRSEDPADYVPGAVRKSR